MKFWEFGKKSSPDSSSSMNNSKTPSEHQLLQMYEAFSDELFRFCLAKTRNRDESLDITQEVFIKTWDYLRQGKKIDMARGFLYKTARNLIIDRSRKKTSMSLDSLIDDKNISPEAMIDHEHYGEILDQKFALTQLEQLPEHHYEILVLRYIQELTLAEIAQFYKESENTVSVRIHRAIKYAQKLFPEEII